MFEIIVGDIIVKSPYKAFDCSRATGMSRPGLCLENFGPALAADEASGGSSAETKRVPRTIASTSDSDTRWPSSLVIIIIIIIIVIKD